MKRKLHLVFFWMAVSFTFTGCSVFQSSAKSSAQETSQTATARTADPIANAVRGNLAIEGLFTVYQDTTTGSTKMLINADQIGEEFIYWGHSVDGPVQVGLFRGAYRDNKVISIQRHFDRIEFVVENTSFYFDDENPVSRASGANIARAVVASEKILAEDTETGRILINSDAIFLSESLHQIKPSPRPGMPAGAMFTLGNLSRDKTKFIDIRSYPENTAVVVEYVYDNPAPVNRGGLSVTDARSVAIRYQHSFIKMPDNDFKPRRDDPRVGYFGQQVNDQTSMSATPYRDVINRWNLVKKDPDAALSEPVEPITWWMENTTPHEFRPVIEEAVLAWNKAFEAAGFLNAVQVKVQPDTADWDSGDIRYNVLRWTSSPQPPFGGYGPSFTNPSTGQIIGADIMLELVFLRNALNAERLFADDVANDFLSMGVFHEQDHDHEHADGMYCSAGHFLQFNNMFGMAAAEALNFDAEERERLVFEALYYLIMHEVGHTFGLNHNMGAHNLLGGDDLHNMDLTREKGLIGSVMDYPAINVALDQENQGQFYITTAGPYDVWAIQYGYSPSLDDADAEEARLNSILARSTEPELFFGNDADDMRSPGKAIDPRIMIGAMSADPIGYAQDRVTLSHQILDGVFEKYAKEGQSYQELYNAYMSTMGQISTSMTVTSRFIGGVMIDRGFHGQSGATQPYTAVPLEEQKRAMASLKSNLFAPDAFETSNEVYNYLQRQRRGFSFGSTTEDPKIHDLALNLQRNVLAHVLHPVVLKRLTDSRLYGNEYAAVDFMGDLTESVFAADLRSNVNTFRQNLQVEYVTRLASILRESNNPYDNVARSAALYNLENIKRMMEGRSRGTAETQAHTRHVLRIIESTLDV
ncbi:MAG: zinc-dependent metalloprotease [Balneolales bacterium]|nr:zinc-dependent metalloprotease [Balneolales bacterium]